MYGKEQEYFILSNEYRIKGNEEQGRYYCSVGTGNALNRKIVEQHLDVCLRAGLRISGINAEVAPSLWVYQIGACLGFYSGDQLLISRYLLERIAEKYSICKCCFHKFFGKSDCGFSEI